MIKKIKKILEMSNKFNNLTVIRLEKTINKIDYYLCKCECGNYTIVNEYNLLYNRVKKCGHCRGTHHLKNTRIYKTWQRMKERCYNKNNKYYNIYGNRGITVCDKWLHDPVAFYNWSIINGYKDNLTIDRIDNNKGYSPENCRWATIQIQNINQGLRVTNKSGYKGVFWHKRTNKWKSVICFNHKNYELGYFKDIKKAVQVRNDYITLNNLPHAIQSIS